MKMATDITVDSKGVVLPLEMLNAYGEGIAVLTLARGAYLIMSADMLAAYPRQRLVELSQTAQALERSRPQEGVTFTRRKQQAMQKLRQQGYPVSDGLEHGLQAMAKPGTTLEQVRQGLSTMAGSLSQEVLAERQERP
jgi:hypothetical protein